MNQLKQHGGELDQRPLKKTKQRSNLGNPEHCLSYLLHSAKCNADLTVFPMQWGVRYVSPSMISKHLQKLSATGRGYPLESTRDITSAKTGTEFRIGPRSVVLIFTSRGCWFTHITVSMTRWRRRLTSLLTLSVSARLGVFGWSGQGHWGIGQR